MDILIKAIAYIHIGLAILVAFGVPFLIGKDRKNPIYTAGDYISSLFQMAVIMVLVGRCLGWW